MSNTRKSQWKKRKKEIQKEKVNEQRRNLIRFIKPEKKSCEWIKKCWNKFLDTIEICVTQMDEVPERKNIFRSSRSESTQKHNNMTNYGNKILGFVIWKMFLNKKF